MSTSILWRSVTLLLSSKPCYFTHRSRVQILSHSYATVCGIKPNIKEVAVIGGGITGLASAHYLTRCLPDTPITIFESSDRLGGWLNSTSVDVGSGKVIFEQGPRNLRPTVPNGLITLDLVSQCLLAVAIDISLRL